MHSHGKGKFKDLGRYFPGHFDPDNFHWEERSLISLAKWSKFSSLRRRNLDRDRHHAVWTAPLGLQFDSAASLGLRLGESASRQETAQQMALGLFFERALNSLK